MRRNIFFIVLLAALMFQCTSSSVIFNKDFSFKDQKWNRFQKLEIETLVDASDKEYDINFVLKYSSHIQYNVFPIHVIFQTPAGEERIREVELAIRNINDELIGEKQGDIVVLKKSLWKHFSFPEQGKINITIENILPKIEAENVISAGIEIVTSE